MLLLSNYVGLSPLTLFEKSKITKKNCITLIFRDKGRVFITEKMVRKEQLAVADDKKMPKRSA